MVKKATHIPDYTLAEALAVKAIMEGAATENQQKMAMKFIINKLCETYKLTYEPDSFDLTAFRAGKSFIGQVLVGMVQNETINQLKSKETK